MEENIIMEDNMIVLRDPKIFCFDFDWSNYVEENLKNEFKAMNLKQRIT